METERTEKLPETIHTYQLGSYYEGTGSRIVRAAADPETLERIDNLWPRKPVGYDRYYHRATVAKPRSIATLERKFGDRVEFEECEAGEVGCWIDGKPHRLNDNDGYPEYSWNKHEREYLESLVVYRKYRDKLARREKSPT
jgi:hypothetical protein